MTLTSTLQARLLSSLDFREIEPDLFVFLLKTQIGFGESQGDFAFPLNMVSSTPAVQGVLDGAELENLKKGGPAYTLKKKELVVLFDSEKKMLREQGFVRVTETLHKDPEMDAQKRYNGIFELFETHPELTADNLVRLDHGSHSVYDRFGTMLPVAVRFDYIRSQIGEGEYDLESVAAHLMSRPDIQVLMGGDEWEFRKDKERGEKIPEKPKDAIFNVPHYNEEEGRNKSVQFIWMPTDEDFKALISSTKSPISSMTNIHNLCLKQDVFGLSAFKHKPKKKHTP